MDYNFDDKDRDLLYYDNVVPNARKLSITDIYEQLSALEITYGTVTLRGEESHTITIEPKDLSIDKNIISIALEGHDILVSGTYKTLEQYQIIIKTENLISKISENKMIEENDSDLSEPKNHEICFRQIFTLFGTGIKIHDSDRSVLYKCNYDSAQSTFNITDDTGKIGSIKKSYKGHMPVYTIRVDGNTITTLEYIPGKDKEFQLTGPYGEDQITIDVPSDSYRTIFVFHGKKALGSIKRVDDNKIVTNDMYISRFEDESDKKLMCLITIAYDDSLETRK